MYYLTLGHSPALSLLELQALGFSPRVISDHLVALKNPSLVDRADQLGGITRVTEFLQWTTPDSLISDLRQLLAKTETKNVAISNYSSYLLASAQLSELKSSLSRPLRFLSFETSGHSLIALRKQHVAEFSLLEDQGKLGLARTVWIQDADSWAFRDRRRPYQDIKRGMLPLKLARVMVNLATGGSPRSLLDPFCGTGTILMEAILTGSSVIGSDLDTQAIEGSQANLAWLISQYSMPDAEYHLHLSDSTHISDHVTSVDCIATEPYLGPLIDLRHPPSIDKLRNIARGLDKLYRGSLKAWYQLLPPQGRAVMIIPEFHLAGHRLRSLGVDAIKRLGYNIVSQVPYSQPKAVVVRLVTVLEKS